MRPLLDRLLNMLKPRRGGPEQTYSAWDLLLVAIASAGAYRLDDGLDAGVPAFRKALDHAPLADYASFSFAICMTIILASFYLFAACTFAIAQGVMPKSDRAAKAHAGVAANRAMPSPACGEPLCGTVPRRAT
ncbi:hypothetical protein ACIPPQ_21200 [Sphingopyxis sp. LARHCG72]